MSGYTVIRSRRRTLALQVTKDCRVVVRAPLYAAGDDIDRFVAEHEAWIAAQLARQAQRLTQHPPRSPEEQEALHQKARLTLPPLVHFWARQMGVTPTGVKITAARSRFGSCSGKNSLSFPCISWSTPRRLLRRWWSMSWPISATRTTDRTSMPWSEGLCRTMMRE